MAAQARRFRWLDCNDMEVFYIDAGLSVADLAVRFHTRKRRILGILKGMGVPIRARGDSSVNVIVDGATQSVKGFRDKTTARAFVGLRDRLAQIDEGTTIALSADGRYIVIDFPSIPSACAFMVSLNVPPDEDADSLSSRIGRGWKTTLRWIHGDYENGSRQWIGLPTLHMPVVDLPSVTR